MDRTILHCDMNSFFASVELLPHPELRDKPVAVSGSPKDRRGIILAKNELAKRRGVKTAQTIWQAKQKCPNLILLPPHHDKYEEYCKIINAIYLRYTDMVEPFSIDESWLDITASLDHFQKSGKEIADEIRTVVKNETGLTLSAGVSFNKIFAKMGSDYKKPDATTVINNENYKQILWPMPVRELFFVGAVTADKLKSMNIISIGDLATSNPEYLVSSLGKHGQQLYDYANGLDESPVAYFTDRKEYKSVGNGLTFKRDLTKKEDIRTALKALCDRVAARLRAHDIKCMGIKIDIKDPSFKVISRQTQLDIPTNLSSEIFETAMQLLQNNWRFGDPIRLLTITGINLVQEQSEEQLSLFFNDNKDKEKQRAVEETIDSIRVKFGKYAIIYLSLIHI